MSRSLKLAVLRNELGYLQQALGAPCRYLRAIRIAGYLTAEECESIASCTSNPEKIELFISKLCSQKSDKAFDVFVAELRKQRVDASIAVHLKREADSKWFCYHCKSLNQLQSWECEKCALPKAISDSMAKAVSKDFVQNQLYQCSSCGKDVELASLPANRQLDEFKVCYKCLKQANPKAASGIVEMHPQVYQCLSCGKDVEKASLPANRQLDEFKVCYKCLKQANPEATSGIVEMHQQYYHHGEGEPIFVDQPPREISVHAGEDLILQCKATGNPPPKYQWFDGQRNPLEGKDQPTLVIENVTQAVQGYYICRAVSCSDSKCSASSCCKFSEYTNVIVSYPCQPKPREPPDHPTFTSQSSAEANPPAYLQQQPAYPYQPPQAMQLPSQVQNVKSEVIHQQNSSFHSLVDPHVREIHTPQQSRSPPHGLPQESHHKWLARGSPPPPFRTPFQGLPQGYTPSSQPTGLPHQRCPPTNPNEPSPARMFFPGQLQHRVMVQQTQHRAQVLQPQFTVPQDLPLQPQPLPPMQLPPTQSSLQAQHRAQVLPPQFTVPQDLPLQPQPLHTQSPMQPPPTHSSLQAQPLSHAELYNPNIQQVSSIPPQQNQQVVPNLEQFNSPLPTVKPVPKPRGKKPSGLLKSDSTSSSAEANPPAYLQQQPAHPYQPPQAMQLPSQVQNVKSEVIHQQNSSFHSQVESPPHGLPQESQPSQSGLPPPLPFRGLPQSYTPSSQPTGLPHQRCPPTNPNEPSPARMFFPGQLQHRVMVQQTQHRAQVLPAQITMSQDLPLQPQPLHTQPSMQPPPTQSSLQAQPLSHAELCNPNIQQVSSIPPQQNQQAVPNLEQFNSPPPTVKPVPKPRGKKPSGLLKSDSTLAGTPTTVPGPNMLHGTLQGELPGTTYQPSRYDAITLECHHNPPTPKSKKLLDDALKDGFILTDITNVLCIGSAGVGKSHLKFLLLRKRPPIHRCSTPCAEAAVRVVACSRMAADEHDDFHEVSLEEVRRWLAQSASTGGTLGQRSPTTHSQQSDLVNSSDISDPENLPTENPSRSQSSYSSRSSPSIAKPDETTGLAETYRILQLMDKHVLQDNDEFGTKHIHWVHFLDSGGQPQFHEVLPAFIRNTSLSLVVFKLSEALSDYPDTEFYTAEQECFKLGRFSQTNEEIIQYVARSIQSHQFSSHPGSSHGIDHASQKHPRFMLVGTFKDEEHSCPESLQRKNEILNRTLRPFEDIVIPRSNKEIIFPVNGLLAGPDDQDPVAKELRKRIIGSRQHIRAKIPIRWYFLQLEIQALEKKVVKIQECLEIAHKLHFRSDDEVNEALKYIHDLNLIMYFPAVLPDIVFCDPQLLLNKVSQLIEFSFFLSSSKTFQFPGGLTLGMHTRLVNQGTFTPELLDVKSDGYVSGTFSSSELLRLLEHLLLIAKIKEEGKPDEYFMPSLLPLLSSSEISEMSQNTADSNSFAKPLIVYFPDGWSPNGLFCAMVVFLLSSENHDLQWKFLTQNRYYNSQLHLKNGRNFVKFAIEGYGGVVTIINSGRHFEIHTSCPGDLCPEIKHCIFEGIRKACTRFTYSFKCRLAFFCPCGSPPHIAELGDDHSLICTRNRAICYDELTPNYTTWLEAHIAKPGTQSTRQIERDAPPDLRALMNHVSTGTTKWREVGIELGISTIKLNAISYEVRTVQLCFEQVFELWKESKSMPYLWDTIINALKAPQVNEQRLAYDIEQLLTP